MKRFYLMRFIATGVVIAALVVGCSGGSNSPLAPDTSTGPRSTAGGTILLGDPIETAGEISFPVEYSGADDIYALSMRIGFDPDGLEPVGIEWGESVGNDDSTFHHMHRPSFVPLAFARFNGGMGLAGEGRLCTLRFRIRNRERVRAWIIPDEEFIVAYNSYGDRLHLSVGGDAR